MTGPNGQKFDKMLRSEMLRKDDDALRVLRKLAPDVARTIEALDATFAALLAKLEKIEAAHEAHARIAPRLMPGREPDGDEVLQQMRVMTPEARAALLSKMKQ
jgi:hypothetical protein